MDIQPLRKLLSAYEQAPSEFQATSYWNAYAKEILDALERVELAEIRAGKFPILSTFGFMEDPFPRPVRETWTQRWRNRWAQDLLRRKPQVAPYGVGIDQLREAAYLACRREGELSGARPLSDCHTTGFGAPPDLFEVEGRAYTYLFLLYYMRYCFAQRYAPLQGDEVVVELGSGSGGQVEVWKRLYPELTVLCFDLPAQLFACESYLSAVLGADQIVSAQSTLDWDDLGQIKPGKVHFFGNWKFPLLARFEFDLFWNAASFGEMEPAVVRNYLGYVAGSGRRVYLNQAARGKETHVRRASVEQPVTEGHYEELLHTYRRLGRRDALTPLGTYRSAGGYFEAVWALQSS